MLKALYDYGISRRLVLPAGYVNKTIKAYISLSKDGAFQGIYMGSDEAVACPDIGSLANGKDKSNVIVEKRSVVIPEEATAKSRFFLEALRSAAAEEPLLGVCVCALEDTDTAEKIRLDLNKAKVKPADRISFRVDGKSVLQFEQLPVWWQVFRMQFSKGEDSPTARCLITGEPTTALLTTQKIQGLRVVGGHASGDALICFDKGAFCSYNLEKAANAPVSEEAFAAVKAALDDLLKDAPILAGMKFVHWYDSDIPAEEDEMLSGFLGFDFPEEDEEDTPEVNEAAERRKADAVPESVCSGQEAPDLDRVSYYILLLTGVGGRIMIRRFERGSYAELRRNLSRWNEDLRLTNRFGTGTQKPCKLTARLLKLLKYQKIDTNPFERLGKELSGVTPVVIHAIMSNGVLPDSIAAKALAYIRSELLAADDDTIGQVLPNGRACQWLKAWLMRKYRMNHKEVPILEEYNMNLNNTAYHCGGLMAVYAAIQKAAMPDVNTGIVERYYASAIQMPGLVIGQLSSRSNHHLEKLDNKWLAEQYRAKLQEVSVALGTDIPATLSLEQQSFFALGYYQMGARLNKDRAEKIAAAKERAAQEKE